MDKAKLDANVSRTRALLDAAGKIRKAAADEKRDLTDAEIAEVEKMAGEVRTLNAERSKLNAQQADLDALDQAAESLAAAQPRRTSAVAELDGPRLQNGGENWASRVVIPRNQRTDVGRLVAFKGPFAKQEAYAFGRWLLGAAMGHKESIKWCEDMGIPIKATLSSTDNANGGALIPYELSSAIIDLAEEYGVFRRYAEVVPMSTDTQGWPRVTGGMTTYFVGDNTSPTASNPTFDNVDLTAKEIAAYATIPQALAEDSVISLADLVARKISLSFATMEDSCGFIGDGTSTYGGAYGAVNKINDGNHAASIYTAIAGNTAFSTLDLADFEAMVGQLPNYPGIQPAWFISKPGWAASMMRLADAASGNTGAMIVNGIPVPSFLGYPVVWSQVLLKTLTACVSTAAFLFGDLRMAAMFGTRRAVTIAAGGGGSYFIARQTVILGSERFAINVHECGDASNAGPLLLCKFPGA